MQNNSQKYYIWTFTATSIIFEHYIDCTKFYLTVVFEIHLTVSMNFKKVNKIQKMFHITQKNSSTYINVQIPSSAAIVHTFPNGFHIFLSYSTVVRFI